MVLEDEDVAQPAVLLQVQDPLAVRPQNALDFRLGHRSERPIVVRRLDDHFVRADAVHAIEHAVAFAIQRPFHLQRRKLVRHDPKIPPGRIRRAAVLAVRQDLRRRHRLAPRAEGTMLPPDRRRPLQAEVVRPLLPVR